MTELAREYGEALYELAGDEGIRPQLYQELDTLVVCFKEQHDFIRLLGSRNIDCTERIKIVDETFGEKAHPYIVNFMKLLIERGRIEAFEDCAKWFHQRYNDDFGIVEARVTTAVELSEEALNALMMKLEAVSGKKVRIIRNIDPTLIGGVRVEMNGRRIDNTIQSRLDKLKRSLMKSL